MKLFQTRLYKYTLLKKIYNKI